MKLTVGVNIIKIFEVRTKLLSATFLYTKFVFVFNDKWHLTAKNVVREMLVKFTTRKHPFFRLSLLMCLD